MKVLVSEHITDIASSFSDRDLLALESAMNRLAPGVFSELVDELQMSKVDSVEYTWAFNFSHLNIYASYMEDLDVFILVDVMSDDGSIQDNIELLKERSLPREWINVAAYFLAEKEKFNNDPKSNWFAAKNELMLRARKLWKW